MYEITNTEPDSVTAWDRYITLKKNKIEYWVCLHWDTHDGYEMTWKDTKGNWIVSPDWATDLDYATLEQETYVPR